MENGLYSLKNKFVFILTSVFFISCSKTKKTSDYKLSEIEHGFLICRAGNGIFSDYFKKLADKNNKYSHVGLVVIEDKKLYIYHSEASELTGVGFVKKEKFDDFIKESNKIDFFKFNKEDIKSKVIKEVITYYKKKTKFDLDFNSFDDKELYCTELIAVSINKALKRKLIKPTLLLAYKKMFSLNDIYENKIVTKVDRIKYLNSPN